MGFNSKPVCVSCNKEPHEIRECVFEARMVNMTPKDWVLETERPTTDGNFYCTYCYVKDGMPSW